MTRFITFNFFKRNVLVLLYVLPAWIRCFSCCTEARNQVYRFRNLNFTKSLNCYWLIYIHRWNVYTRGTRRIPTAWIKIFVGVVVSLRTNIWSVRRLQFMTFTCVTVGWLLLMILFEILKISWVKFMVDVIDLRASKIWTQHCFSWVSNSKLYIYEKVTKLTNFVILFLNLNCFKLLLILLSWRDVHLRNGGNYWHHTSVAEFINVVKNIFSEKNYKQKLTNYIRRWWIIIIFLIRLSDA